MTIYFNQHYTNRPYLNGCGRDCFNAVYCGADGLLSVLMLHGGIAVPTVSAEERKAVYHNNMRKCIHPEQTFYKSFVIDSFTASSAVLAWRDALVAAGWDMSCGDSPKLQFIREMEPKGLPRGEADCWNEVLRLSREKTMLPDNSEIIVTQDRNSVEPKMAALFDNLQRLGVPVEYRPDGTVATDGNLGRLQRWFQNARQGKIDMTESDDTLQLLHFKNEDDAMRYIATQPSDRWSLYYCQQPKQFDNILRMTGQPACGSGLTPCEAQVAQLFTLGNGLFEYPLNMNRIIVWLSAPVNPLGRALCRKLADALASSGGIGNEEWTGVVNEYLDSFGEDENARREAKRKMDIFLPFSTANDVNVADVESLNKALRKWANGVMSMDEFPYDEIVREQLRQIDICCAALLDMLHDYEGTTISFVELQGLCRGIVSRKSYTQYVPETGCRTTIANEGDLHSEADSLVWFCIADSDTAAYPFDFLTAAEYGLLTERGVYLYDKTQYVQMRYEAMVQTLLRSRRLTLVETDKIGGEAIRRHPLILQLESAVEGKLDKMFCRPTISAEMLVKKPQENNRSDEPVLQLEAGVVPQPRWAKEQPESYSGLEKLFQHPFDYLCEYCASLKDIEIPTMADKNRTMGNVAHLMIEKVFGKTDKAEQGRVINDGAEYERIFNEAVDSKGLLLRRPEYAIELRNMKSDMKKVLRRLQEIIITNGLTVDGCEYQFRTYDWAEAGDNVKLASRADMLLTDDRGGKVIFDFKWSAKSKYRKSIEENTSLQLAIYKRLAENEFGCGVRTAYILLPSMEFVSGDEFEDNTPVRPDSPVDIMTLAANSYAWRWRQFSKGRVERAEGLALTDSEYGAAQQTEHLFPLEIYNNKIEENIYDDYKKLR